MIRRIKALVSSFVIATVAGVAAAPSVHAGHLDIGASPAVVSGHAEAGQQHILTIPGSGSSFNVICNSATLEGGTTGTPLDELTVTPTFGGCRLAGSLVTVQMNGCRYTFTGIGQPTHTFSTDIVGCTAGKQIQIKWALCTVDIPQQNGLAHLVASNTGLEGNEVTLSATMAGITNLQTGLACPAGNNAHGQTMSFSGNTTLKAFTDGKQGGQSPVIKHGHEYVEQVPGELVGLVAT
jgi:hypothetical protein